MNKRVETISCGCTGGAAAEFQDRRYGKGRRVFTVNAEGAASCTVCSRQHTILIREIPNKKKGGGSGGGVKTMTVYPPPGGWPGGLPENNGYKRFGGK